MYTCPCLIPIRCHNYELDSMGMCRSQSVLQSVFLGIPGNCIISTVLVGMVLENNEQPFVRSVTEFEFYGCKIPKEVLSLGKRAPITQLRYNFRL